MRAMMHVSLFLRKGDFSFSILVFGLNNYQYTTKIQEL